MEDAGPDLHRRAMAAYYRSAVGTPPKFEALTKTVAGREYVVLETEDETLAVYRVRAYDGKLRRLRRWPEEVTRRQEEVR